MRKPLIVLLVLSLMGNAVALGVHLGRRHLGPSRPAPAFTPPDEAREALAALDDDGRRALSDGLAAARRDLLAAKAEQGTLHRRAFEQLTAEVFDEAAWRASVEQLVSSRRARGERMTDAVADLARGRDRQARLALAALLYDRRHRR